MEKLKPIIAEWFASLPKGYATPPYTLDEVNLLRIIITEADDLDEPEKDALLKHVDKISSDEAEPETESEPEEKQDRFIAKSAPFIQSANAFIEFIKSEYANPGTEIMGLEELFNSLVALDTDNFNAVVKLMAKHTNRQVEYGTFKMGQYELKLAELLHTHVKLDTASSLNLLLAILFNGKVYTPPPNGLSKLAVSISGTKLIKCESTEDYVTLGAASPKLAEIYKNIETLNSTIHSNDNADTMTTNDLQVLLSSLQDGSLDDDISKIIQQGQTSKIPALKLLAGKLEQMLQGKSPQIIFETFKQLYNLELSQFSTEFTKIFDVSRDRLIIESTSEIKKKLLITDKVPSTVQLANSQIKIDSRLLNLAATEKENENA